MAYQFPEYITHAAIRSPEIRYAWDDWDVHKAYQPAEPALLDPLQSLSRRAIVALTIASSEWPIFRLNDLDQDPNPPDFLEAAWAASIDPAYMVYEETDDSQWRGPIRGPLNVAMMMILDVIFVERQTADPAPHPAWMSNLATMVLPDPSEFIVWRDGCIARLALHFPVNPADPFDPFSSLDWGECIPREAFNLNREFDPTEAPALIDRFLRNLDPSENPFLYSADEMIERLRRHSLSIFEGTSLERARERTMTVKTTEADLGSSQLEFSHLRCVTFCKPDS